jgi:hypothetical protein
MRRITVLAALLAAAVSFANPPFTVNVRAAGYGDSINMGETAMGMLGPNIYTISNTSERGTYPVAPFGRSTDGGQTWLPTLGFRDATAPNQWHTDPSIAVDPQGRVHMVIQYSTAVIRHYLSTDGGVTWCIRATYPTRGPAGRWTGTG